MINNVVYLTLIIFALAFVVILTLGVFQKKNIDYQIKKAETKLKGYVKLIGNETPMRTPGQINCEIIRHILDDASEGDVYD